MTSFRKQMWDMCSQQHVFEKMENTEFEKVKSIFETNIENYKTHILQTNGDEKIKTLLLSNIKKDIENSKQKFETREDISNARKEKFNSEFQNKQTEFNSSSVNKKPENLDFSDGAQDTPLEADNLESLIQEQLKDRELHIPTQSNETNTIVSGNQFTDNSPIKIKQENVELSNFETIKEKKEEDHDLKHKQLVSEILKLRQQVNSQNEAIHKILSSQILILKKLK
jgi:acid stress-induced BolA-like protein IbaG/YrbA